MGVNNMRHGMERRTLIGGALATGLAGALPGRLLAAAPDGRLFKCTEFLRRAPGMTPDAFLAHWEKERAPLLLGLKGLRGLIFNRVIRERSPDAPHDGIIEMWFADEAAYTHAFGAADEQLIGALADDLPHFAAGDPMGLFTREVSIRIPNSKPGNAKRIGLVGRNPGTTEDQFFREWRTVHAKEAANQPGLAGYVLNMRAGPRLPDLPWDGYAQLWWTDWPAFEAASRAIHATVGARLHFFHAHQLYYVDEFVALALQGRFG
ncbi:hypothetical protein Sj15T_29470 [Sphingobium sp. TA15]|uniref:EthD domain-containing protein n=2 Tax=Sphingomonadaceae TaxID=41297 RepID=D4YXG4_SPHIU|nr:conserved hypothetical protein [Sphingobium indicum UT26S]BDD67926.1 hypothetical protein Sj15T_29470 [Sphingobium sp. TA15]